MSVSEIKIRNIRNHVRTIAAIGPRPDGTPEDHLAIAYVKRELAAAGTQVGSMPMRVPVIQNERVTLEILGDGGYSIPCRPQLRPGLTPPGGLVAPLAFVGKAFADDFKTRDVKGKIVFCYEDGPFEGPTPEQCNFPGVKTANAAAAGAVGLIFSSRRVDNYIQTWGLHRELDVIPSVSIPFPELEKLRARWETNPDLQARLTVYGDVIDGETEVIWGVLPGTEAPERSIVIYGSHHETNPGAVGANDNASGLAIMFELASYFAAAPHAQDPCLRLDLW